LKDDKSYPALRLTSEDFPRLFRTRRVLRDGSRYFGPFPNAGALEMLVEALHCAFPLRRCRRLHKRINPCLYFHIGRCAAPCCGKITKEAYAAHIAEIAALLEDGGEHIRGNLAALMRDAADKLDFEKAAKLRDGLNALSVLKSDTFVQEFDVNDRDYIAWAREGELASFIVLKLRGGRLVGRDAYRACSLNEEHELMPEFLVAYYADAALIPPKIYVPATGGLALIREWFRTQFPALPSPPEIRAVPLGAALDALPAFGDSAARQDSGAEFGCAASGTEACGGSAAQPGAAGETPPPASGTALAPMQNADSPLRHEDSADSGEGAATDARHAAALGMARQNAREDIARRVRERGDLPAMQELQKTLKLPSLPARIEGFDIAHLDGKFPVASMVSFHNGNPDKKRYRYFRLKTTEGAVDDFASMREAASRRYTRLLNEQGDFPDLILVDGGIGQVNAVHGILCALDLDIPVAGLAKRDEEVYLPGDSAPLSLPRRSDALRLLQRVRDETHRFATSRNQRLRTKENIESRFLELPHVGKARERLLIRAFGTVGALAEAAERDGTAGLEKLLKVTAAQAAEIARSAAALSRGFAASEAAQTR
jgi:excinuclease ABC subunit C